MLAFVRGTLIFKGWFQSHHQRAASSRGTGVFVCLKGVEGSENWNHGKDQPREARANPVLGPKLERGPT